LDVHFQIERAAKCGCGSVSSEDGVRKKKEPRQNMMACHAPMHERPKRQI